MGLEVFLRMRVFGRLDRGLNAGLPAFPSSFVMISDGPFGGFRDGGG